MSKFKELIKNVLAESKQVGDLYHTTSEYMILDILRSNQLLSSRPNGISFSRDKHNWYADQPITLVFDGDKLSENHKLYPFSYHARDSENYNYKDGNSETSLIPRKDKPRSLNLDPDEIFCDHTFVLPQINKYLKEIIINKKLLDPSYLDLIPYLQIEYPHIPFTIIDSDTIHTNRKK